MRWWTDQLASLAAVPSPEARVTSLLSQLRELRDLEPTERMRLTRARMLALRALPSRPRGVIQATVDGARKTDATVVADDQRVVDAIGDGPPRA